MKHNWRNLLALSLILVGSAFAAAPVVHTEVDEVPQPLRTPPPAYPAQLKADKVSGLVLVDLVIDDQGQVGQVDVVKSSATDFEAPTLDAVKQWRFRPARKGGEAVWVRLRLPVKFTPAT